MSLVFYNNLESSSARRYDVESNKLVGIKHQFRVQHDTTDTVNVL